MNTENNNKKIDTAALSWSEKFLSYSANIRAGEGRNILLLMSALFFLLITVYLLKPVKEMLILVQGSAELRSYTVGLQVIILIVLLPIYGYFSRHFDSKKFMVAIAFFFAFNLGVFYVLGIVGHNAAIPFFIWLGAFGVLMVSQFWAYASQIYTKENGERLFALVAIGASTGSWIGSIISRVLVHYFTANEMILISIIPLMLSVLLATKVEKSDEVIGVTPQLPTEAKPPFLSSFSLVAKNRYLVLIALFVIIMNWCSSTGEYLLSALVERFYLQAVELQTISETKESFIGKFYSEFYFYVNFIGAIVQIFIVARLIKWAGFNIAFILTPILIFMGYGLLALFPIITFFRIVKVTENGFNYSLQNTTLQILYLPTTRREKYEARAAIDTVCWKLGDLLQAASVFIGLNLLHILPKQFLFLNITLAVMLIIIAYFLARMYQEKTKQVKNNDKVALNEVLDG